MEACDVHSLFEEVLRELIAARPSDPRKSRLRAGLRGAVLTARPLPADSAMADL